MSSPTELARGSSRSSRAQHRHSVRVREIAEAIVSLPALGLLMSSMSPQQRTSLSCPQAAGRRSDRIGESGSCQGNLRVRRGWCWRHGHHVHWAVATAVGAAELSMSGREVLCHCWTGHFRSHRVLPSMTVTVLEGSLHCSRCRVVTDVFH